MRGGEPYQSGFLLRISSQDTQESRFCGIYKSREGREEVLQPVIYHRFHQPPPNLTQMDSFFSFFAPSETTTSGEQQDFPVEFETGGGTSGGGCVIA